MPDLEIRYNVTMRRNSFYPKAQEVILQDAIQRDLPTARRAALLEILWHERYLTRAQLMARVGLQLGKHCFGTSAWEDTFYRDMHVVKQAFKAAARAKIERKRIPLGTNLHLTSRDITRKLLEADQIECGERP